jgi:2-iminobutanoate/2-iminopropanoate deaminase
MSLKIEFGEMKMKKLFLALPLIVLFGCDVEVEHGPDVTYLQMPGMEGRNLPFSSAVSVGHTLYLSGNLGNMPGSLDLAEGGIGPETRQTMENISNVLQQFGSSMDEVVKCTVFLADINEWSEMNEVYRTYFKNPPARSALGASGLALGARVEIECIAVTE